MSCIVDLLDYFLDRLVFFFQCCGISYWNGCAFVGIVLENTFQASLGAVNKELTITSIIMPNTEKKKNLLRVTTIHEVSCLLEE